MKTVHSLFISGQSLAGVQIWNARWRLATEAGLPVPSAPQSQAQVHPVLVAGDGDSPQEIHCQKAPVVDGQVQRH